MTKATKMSHVSYSLNSFAACAHAEKHNANEKHDRQVLRLECRLEYRLEYRLKCRQSRVIFVGVMYAKLTPCEAHSSPSPSLCN